LTKYLFIGGPKHGRVIPTKGVHWYDVAVPQDALKSTATDWLLEYPLVGTVKYQRRRLAFNGRPIDYYSVLPQADDTKVICDLMCSLFDIYIGVNS
jgi:hypothetical protein